MSAQIGSPRIVVSIALLHVLLLVSGRAFASYVTFSFDDGYEDNILAYNILDRYGYSAAVNVVPVWIGNNTYLSSEQLHLLQSKGWEIASHSMTHADLSTLSHEDAYTEIVGSKDVLTSMGFSVTTFVRPGGGWNEELMGIAALGYDLAFASERYGRWLNEIPTAADDYYNMGRKNIYNYSTVDDAIAYASAALERESWIVFVLHRITDDDSNIPPGYWSSHRLDDFSAWIAEQGDLRVATYKEVYSAAFLPVPDPLWLMSTGLLALFGLSRIRIWDARKVDAAHHVSARGPGRVRGGTRRRRCGRAGGDVA